MDLLNHSYVNLSLVGNASDGSDSVQCHTDLSTCCSSDSNSSGWFPPKGQRMGNIFETPGDQQINLHRGGMSGIYYCLIPVDGGTEEGERVYVGLYDEGGEEMTNGMNCYCHDLLPV